MPTYGCQAPLNISKEEFDQAMKKTVIYKYNKKTIFLFLTLCWTLLIFSFSLQPGNVSSDLSHGFGRWLMKTFLPGFIDYMEHCSVEKIEQLHFLLRKCAHFIEYLILGVLAWMSVRQTKYRNILWIPVMFCILVASVDETIQLFVDGRSGRTADVILDSAGACTGIFMMFLWCQVLLKNYKKHKKEDRL